jgi:putative ABC transport system permease protein
MTMLTDLPRDFRYAARSLLRTPGFTVVAVAVLALGIGATSAIFSLLSAVWLKPLPFIDAERVVSLWVDQRAMGGSSRVELAPANYVDWQQRAQSFESMAPLEVASFNLTGSGGDPERLTGVRTKPSLFTTIGLEPMIGRTFAPDDGTGEPVAVISEGFWLRRFGGDPAAVGRTITLDGSPHLVVGVVPPDFRFPTGLIDVFVPTTWTPAVLAQDTSYFWYLVAKLRAGVSLEAARAEMNAISTALRAEYPNTGRGIGVTIAPLRETLARGAGPAAVQLGPRLFALVGAATLVLLIACANVANLILARATRRQKELAIRKALGAARGRVVRQLLTESVLLAAMSVVVGLAIAMATFGYLARLIPSTLPASTALGVDLRVLALTIAAALVTVLLFGVGPAFAAAARDFGVAFGRAVGPQGARARRLRAGLVVAEVALTFVLLAGAGLLLRSYVAVLAVDPGFDTQGLLVAETVLPQQRAANPAERESFYRRVLEGVRALPGVEGAGYTRLAPLMSQGGRSLVLIDGRPRPEPGEIVQHLATNRNVSPGYLEALGVPLIRGRHVDERDVRGAPLTVVINESLARKYWPDEDPIGRRLAVGGGEPLTVIGVVADVRQLGLDVPIEPAVFVPADQISSPAMAPRHLVVRTAGDPLALAASVRSAIWAVDPDQPVSSVRAMTEVLDSQLADRDTQLTLLGSFAVLALLLAGIGLFGVLSYTVSQSTNEIGLRMALGAEQTTVVGTVVRSALATSVVGIVVGLVAAYALTRMIESFLYGVSPTDPATAAAVAGVLLLVAGLAALVPALRAASVNPMTALRAEG